MDNAQIKFYNNTSTQISRNFIKYAADSTSLNDILPIQMKKVNTNECVFLVKRINYRHLKNTYLLLRF
jgi:hypothetical protein